MNIMDAVVGAGDGRAVRQIGAQLGLGDEQTAVALSALLPALAAGFQRNLESEGGVASLLSALSRGGHQQYVENPAVLSDERAIAEGNGILGHVFGSKDVSRQVASRAAAQTGLGADVMKKMLPLAATLMMGVFAQRSAAASPGPGAADTGGGILSMLTPLLDSNRDGSIVDDVTGMIGRYFGR
jgi:hypothetical protein